MRIRHESLCAVTAAMTIQKPPTTATTNNGSRSRSLAERESECAREPANESVRAQQAWRAKERIC